MALKPIDPYDDPRVTHEFAVLNGRRYHYAHGLPQQKPPRATILCIHGFPDLWYSWRHIIPGLLETGLRVIAPDMIGYGQTDMPIVKPGDAYTPYTWKSSVDDLAELLRQLEIPRVILLGHDWGGAIVSRMYLHHPTLVTHIASVCTPYYPPLHTHVPVEELIKFLPSFTYQIALCDPQTERDLESRDAIERFLRGLHRGLGDGFTGNIQVTKDFMENLGDQPRGKLMSQKDLDYYVEQFSRNGMHGPLNWYKTRYENHLDEKDVRISTVDVPYLYVAATHDVATPPKMAANQGKSIPNLTTREIKSSHWVMEEAPTQLLEILNEWLEKVCFGPHSKL